MPRISILCPSFNHQRFIGFCIQSALEQTFDDFELIIVDDCSDDDNVKEILKFQDERIKLVRHSFNRGINASLNTAFENSSGEYLVFLAGDDCLEKNALEVINGVLDITEAIVVYPKATQIDIDNRKVKAWEIDNKDRFSILHTIFMETNCLFSPGMSIKRKVFEEHLYPLDNSMCLHQDTQMHIKLLINGDIKFLNKYLILYRFDDRARNISGSFVAYCRSLMETEKMMDTFLEIRDVELLKRVFKEEIDKIKINPKLEFLEFFLGNVALLSSDYYRQVWGYHKIMESFDTSQKAVLLKNEYGFEFKDYLKFVYLLSGYDVADKFRRKYKKYRKFSFLFFGVSVALLLIMLYGV